MSKSRGLRKHRTQAQWSDVVRRLATSDESLREFCRQEGVSPSSVQRWRTRLGGAPAGEFVELSPPAAAGVAPSGWMIELTLPNGASLRLRG
jgi:transposase-like protein